MTKREEYRHITSNELEMPARRLVTGETQVRVEQYGYGAAVQLTHVRPWKRTLPLPGRLVD